MFFGKRRPIGPNHPINIRARKEAQFHKKRAIRDEKNAAKHSDPDYARKTRERMSSGGGTRDSFTAGGTLGGFNLP